MYLVDLYCNEIKNNNTTIEDVPVGLRKKVQEELDKEVESNA